VGFEGVKTGSKGFAASGVELRRGESRGSEKGKGERKSKKRVPVHEGKRYYLRVFDGKRGEKARSDVAGKKPRTYFSCKASGGERGRYFHVHRKEP